MIGTCHERRSYAAPVFRPALPCKFSTLPGPHVSVLGQLQQLQLVHAGLHGRLGQGVCGRRRGRRRPVSRRARRWQWCLGRRAAIHRRHGASARPCRGRLWAVRLWEEGRGWGARLRAVWALLARSLADWRARQSHTLGAGPDGAQTQAAHASSCSTFAGCCAAHNQVCRAGGRLSGPAERCPWLIAGGRLSSSLGRGSAGFCVVFLLYKSRLRHPCTEQAQYVQ